MRFDDLHTHLHARASFRVKPAPSLRFASVAVVVRPGGELLFIRRSEQEGDPWSGHMAFPGGRQEERDEDLMQTAVRETREEVGLDLRGARLLGRLDDTISPTRSPARLVISAFVFAIADPAPVLTINHEVAAVRWLALERLLAEEGRSSMEYQWRGSSVTLPSVQLDDAHIWGITLRIVDDLLERVRVGGG